MFIKVLDPKNEIKYHVEAAYIQWVKNIISIYPMITKVQRVAAISESYTEVCAVPSVNIHLEHGDTVFVMNNDGKTIDKKKIVLDGKKQQQNDIYAAIEAVHTAQSDTELPVDQQIDVIVEFAERVREAKEKRGCIDDVVKRKMLCLAGLVVRCMRQRGLPE